MAWLHRRNIGGADASKRMSTRHGALTPGTRKGRSTPARLLAMCTILSSGCSAMPLQVDVATDCFEDTREREASCPPLAVVDECPREQLALEAGECIDR